MPYPCRPRLLLALAVLFCAFLAPLIPFAASAQQSKPSATGRKTVCVASAIGRKYELKTIGLMVFGNDLKSAPIGSWGIDSLVLQRLGAALGSSFSVKPAGLPAGVLTDFYPGPNLFGRHDEALRSAIRDSKAGCAYYVVAAPMTGQFQDTNQGITGLGIVKREAIFKVHYVYAVYTLQIYDGRTAEWIRQSVDGSEIFANAFSGPSWMELVDESYWPESAQAIVTSVKLRDAARNLVVKLLNRDAQRVLKTLTRKD